MTPVRSPRFHANIGPIGSAKSKGTIRGPNVMLKKADRQKSFARQTFERHRIERADEDCRGARHQQKLLRTRLPSRLIG